MRKYLIPILIGLGILAAPLTYAAVQRIYIGAIGSNSDAALVWDSTNHRLSVNSTTPTATLVVQGSSTAPTIPIFVVASDTNVSLFQVSSNGSTTIANLGTGCISATSGSLYTTGVACGAGGGSASGTAGSIQFSNGSSGFNADQANFVWDNTNKRLGVASSTPNYTLSVGGNSVHTGGYHAFGGQPTTDSFFCNTSTKCLVMSDTDDTTMGVQIEVQNTSAGTHAYSWFGLLNNLASPAGLYYSGCGLNSSNFNDSTFGAGVNTANEMDCMTNLGSMGFMTATGTTNSYIHFLTGGTAVANERLRITSTGLIGIGTTTPQTKLHVQGSAGTNPFAISSSTGTTMLVLDQMGDLGVGSSTPGSRLSVQGDAGQTYPIFTVASSSGAKLFEVTDSTYANVGIGTSTTASNLFVQGNSIAPTVNLFDLASSTGTSLFTVKNTGRVGIGTTTPIALLSLGTHTTAVGGINFGDTTTNLYRDGSGLHTDTGLFSMTSGTAGNGTIRAGIIHVEGQTSAAAAEVQLSSNSTQNYTSGTGGIASITGGNFAPSSGTGVFNIFDINSVPINQTSTANGVTRGVNINPTVTSAYDFRDIEVVSHQVTISNAANPVGQVYSVLFNPLTYGTASTTTYTIATSSTLTVSGAPIASTTRNTILTRSIGLLVDTNALNASSTNGYGLYVVAPTGATNNNAAAFIGKVGVNTTTPVGTALSTTGTVYMAGLTAAAGTPSDVCINAATQEITVNAALTCTVSSKLFKNEHGYLQGGTDLLMQLKPAEFAYKDQPDRLRWGFYAEDVAEVDPKLADGWKDTGPTSLDQNAILAVAVKTIQEQQIEIDNLKTQKGTKTNYLYFGWILLIPLIFRRKNELV